MNDENRGKLLDHNYDGIQELDNPPPGWWLAIFYVTIAFAAVYLVYYQLMGGPSLRDEFKAEWDMIKKMQPAPAPSNDFKAILLAAQNDPKKMENGKAVYDGKCTPCHGPQGQGTIGPNLTDKFWLNGDGSLESIAAVVREGVPAKGMPTWSSVLNEEEIANVSVYVKSLKGSNPPNPKEAQGNPFEN